jgi:phospholipid/cholesterol/gamma-HCH transport system ATP-binding protein
VVSHDVKETMEIADHVCIISAGKVVGQGSREDIARSDSAWIRQFMDGAPDGPVPFHYPAEDYRMDLMGRIESLQKS